MERVKEEARPNAPDLPLSLKEARGSCFRGVDISLAGKNKTYKTYDTPQDIRPVTSEKENPPPRPLAEVVEAAAQHQAAGFSPSTAANKTDSPAKVNWVSEKIRKSFVRPVRLVLFPPKAPSD